MMLELEMSIGVSFRSLEIVSVSYLGGQQWLAFHTRYGICERTSGGNAYLASSQSLCLIITRTVTHQDQKATKNPNQANVNTRP